MFFPIAHRPRGARLDLGGDLARSVTEALVRSVAGALQPLSTADKNRVLLALSAFLGTQLEALETNNEPEQMY
jgi:hypothetical protein